MSLTVVEKELANIGASVATGCKPCTDYHFKKLREAGASDDEIKQAISDAMTVRDSAKAIMEGHGLKHLGMADSEADSGQIGETTRIKELVSIAAAFAVNCTSNLEKHINTSRTVGIAEDEITSVLDASHVIKGEAARYVEEIAKLKEKNIKLQKLLDELKATQAQLVQSEKMAALGKLVAGVAHEMNSPIGVIKSANDVTARSVTNIAEELRHSPTLDDLRASRKLRDSLKALESNNPVSVAASERMTKIVDSLKSFARLDEATIQEADLHEGLESTLTLMEHDLKGRITVLKKFGDIPRIVCLPGDLNQVFMNLLTNASQAIKDKGTITITTFFDNGNVHVEIADTGVGIPSEQMQGLFEPGFTKAGARVKAGLGLFTSYNIVQRHRGQIRVTSDVGQGSTFAIILPANLDGESVKGDITESDREANPCEGLGS